MAKIAHINIYGYVCYEPSDEWADIMGVTRLSDVQNVLNENPDADEVIVHINSPGGDVQEGFGIHDVLVASGKKITVSIEARCYSIATVIALAGETRKMMKNAEFMIHNPWGGAMGTADELQKAADWIRKAEDQLAQFYVEKTGADEQQIRDLMKAETFMSATQALEMKFITEIAEPVKAMAALRKTAITRKQIQNNTITMERKELNAVQDTLNKICKAMSIPQPFKATKLNLDLTIVGGENDGKTLVIDSESDPKVGDTATIDGNPATGTYETTTPDGATWTIVCDAGAVTEATMTSSAADAAAEAKALADANKENARLNALLKAQKKQSSDALAAIQTQLDAVMAKVGSNYQPPVQQNQPPAPAAKTVKEKLAEAEQKRKEAAAAKAKK